MKIGVIGAGNVGGALGRLFAAKGHDVMYSARDPQAMSDKTRKALAATGDQAQVGSVAETVAFGEVIVLAVGYDAVADALTHGGSWQGKIIIDAVNYFGTPKAGSVAQEIAQQAAGAKVVKAFNTLGER